MRNAECGICGVGSKKFIAKGRWQRQKKERARKSLDFVV
jgi:hypothetical protein